MEASISRLTFHFLRYSALPDRIVHLMSGVGITLIHIYVRNLESPICELNSSLDPRSRMILIIAAACMSSGPRLYIRTIIYSSSPPPLWQRTGSFIRKSLPDLHLAEIGELWFFSRYLTGCQDAIPDNCLIRLASDTPADSWRHI